MTRIKTLVLLLTATALLGWFTVGCEKKQTTSKRSDAKVTSAQKLCPKCGQVKGSAKCCKPGATICKKCGKVKGSPGCCKKT